MSCDLVSKKEFTEAVGHKFYNQLETSILNKFKAKPQWNIFRKTMVSLMTFQYDIPNEAAKKLNIINAPSSIWIIIVAGITRRKETDCSMFIQKIWLSDERMPDELLDEYNLLKENYDFI